MVAHPFTLKPIGPWLSPSESTIMLTLDHLFRLPQKTDREIAGKVHTLLSISNLAITPGFAAWKLHFHYGKQKTKQTRYLRTVRVCKLQEVGNSVVGRDGIKPSTFIMFPQ